MICVRPGDIFNSRGILVQFLEKRIENVTAFAWIEERRDANASSCKGLLHAERSNVLHKLRTHSPRGSLAEYISKCLERWPTGESLKRL